MKTEIKHVELDNIIEEINKLQTDTVLIISDHQVWSLYSKDIILEKIENKKVIFWKAADGEKVKNITDFQNAIEFFLEKGIHRNAHLVVIGGGGRLLILQVLLRPLFYVEFHGVWYLQLFYQW